MKLLKIFLVITLLLLIIISASTSPAFYSGNTYIKFSENEKLTYVAGLIDMANLTIGYYVPEIFEKINELTKDMTLGQLVKIFDKYLEENPEDLNKAALACFIMAITEIINQEQITSGEK